MAVLKTVASEYWVELMLYLQELAKLGQQQERVLLTERLPGFIVSPCSLNVSYNVAFVENFYLIHLEVNGLITIECQRCMHELDIPYHNKTSIAACRDDLRAEELLAQYECIVCPNWRVSLDDLVIDELYLYAPQFHQQTQECYNEDLVRKDDLS